LLLDELGRRQFTNVLVEGGATVLRGFINGGLADEIEVYVSPRTAGQGAELPRLDVKTLPQLASLVAAEEVVGEDRLLRYRLT
jgi:diaminohydroxyphosphoribosylaminopyrimidine deaminase/5-amino-6-(5-phosphoribosylamino)uracil reductase